MIDRRQFAELLRQALETEVCGIGIYETAVRCAVHDDRRQEWQQYLVQTRERERILRHVLAQLDLDAEMETPRRLVVRHIGHSLVQAIEIAAAAGDLQAAERVAAECVVFAATQDHLNWELIGATFSTLDGGWRPVLQAAQRAR